MVDGLRSDALADGRTFRCFRLVDNFTRECLGIEVAHSLPALRVIQLLERRGPARGLPRGISCGNGPEFAGRALDLRAHCAGVTLQFIRPGKPIENAYIESFNGRLRDECLTGEWFATLADAQRTIERWRRDDNELRPRRSLAGRTPAEFAAEPTASRIAQQRPSLQRLTA